MTIQISFLDKALTDMSEGNNRNAVIAGLVQSQNHAQPANRIALEFIDLQNLRKTNRVTAIKGGTEIPVMEVKPEHILSFVQQLMNKCCWNGRKVANTNKNADFANGIDFSQAVADQEANLESNAVQDVRTTIHDDFNVLNELHSWLCGKCNYMTDLDPLFLFAQKTEVSDGVWEFTHQLMDFDDVIPVLEEINLELQSAAEAADVSFATDHVFGGDSKAEAIDASQKRVAKEPLKSRAKKAA